MSEQIVLLEVEYYVYMKRGVSISLCYLIKMTLLKDFVAFLFLKKGSQ